VSRRAALAAGGLLILGALSAPGQEPGVDEAARFGLADVPLDAEGLPPGVRSVVGPPAGPRLSGTTLELRTEEVASLLRCPVCQGLSVGDSKAGMALKMKAQVKGLLAAGYEQEQILAYFERSYGEFVRLQPPLRGINWLVWLAPLLGLGLGAFVVTWALRRGAAAEAAPEVPRERGTEADEAELPARDALPDDAELARCVKRVRELAYGWPGGTPPRQGA
jgi:cytochrome c-type biogenesis protein CcmH